MQYWAVSRWHPPEGPSSDENLVYSGPTLTLASSLVRGRQFHLGPGVRGWFCRMIQAHYVYCATVFLI